MTDEKILKKIINFVLSLFSGLNIFLSMKYFEQLRKISQKDQKEGIRANEFLNILSLNWKYQQQGKDLRACIVTCECHLCIYSLGTICIGTTKELVHHPGCQCKNCNG